MKSPTSPHLVGVVDGADEIEVEVELEAVMYGVVEVRLPAADSVADELQTNEVVGDGPQTAVPPVDPQKTLITLVGCPETDDFVVPEGVVPGGKL